MTPRTTPPSLSRATLEVCDELIDRVTLSVQAPDFEELAEKIATARREVGRALSAAGGTPLAVQREKALKGG